LNQRLAENLQTRSQLDAILNETEGAYLKIVEGSQVLLSTIRRSMPVWEDSEPLP
jgi:hypothetical protein